MRVPCTLSSTPKKWRQMPTTPLSRSELLLAFPEVAWQRKLLDVLSLVALLRDSIIEKNYKISDELNAAIVLSDAGKKIREQLITKESVPPKEANLLVLLALVHVEPLVDVEGIDLEKLSAAISRDVKSRAIRYPLVFGRDLYDRAAELFPEEREYLRHEDTLRLLKPQPQGVFQAGKYITGPLGILRADFERELPPTTAVPLQHCSDHSCQAVHRVQLATSIEAGINRNRPALNKVLDEVSEDASEWNGYVSDITENSVNTFDTHDFSTAIFTIGDALDDAELDQLFMFAFENTDGRLKSRTREAGLGDRAQEMLSSLNRASILQLLLTETDDSIVRLTNRLIASDEIHVPEGETRRAQVNSRPSSGSWGFRAQIGRRGFRVVGSTDGLPLLRLTSLVESLFDTGSPEDMDLLSWALRNSPGSTVKEQLADFLRVASPSEVVESLLLARRKNMLAASEELHIENDGSDEDFIEAVVWKLGFGQTPQPDLRDQYWTEHDALERTTKTINVSLSPNLNALRSAAVNYFVSLEAALLDSLHFTSWALLNDHYTSNQAFTFREPVAAAFGAAALSEAGCDLGDKPTLSKLVEGLSALGKHLVLLRESESDHLREVASYPKFAAKTDLQRFPFLHTIPFLDLTAESQVSLIKTLQSASTALNDSGIMTARNSLLHASREVPSPNELTESLESARRAIQSLEASGCVRTTYQPHSTVIDAWGRGATVLRSMNGSEITFSAPSSYRWLGLPTLAGPQYLAQGAVFAAPNFMLRFRRGYESRYEDYWMNYPKRREPGNRVLPSQADSLSTPIETGTFVGSRAD
jgi:hypothetical protein